MSKPATKDLRPAARIFAEFLRKECRGREAACFSQAIVCVALTESSLRVVRPGLMCAAGRAFPRAYMWRMMR